jgi:hypothetical protein
LISASGYYQDENARERDPSHKQTITRPPQRSGDSYQRGEEHGARRPLLDHSDSSRLNHLAKARVT